jgi:branched-chain amino acid aminotransferase
LRDADEIFLTSTAGGVMPVTTIDGKVLSDGIPGPVTTLVRELYWQAHERAEWSLSVNYAAESLDATA